MAAQEGRNQGGEGSDDMSKALADLGIAHCGLLRMTLEEIFYAVAGRVKPGATKTVLLDETAHQSRMMIARSLRGLAASVAPGPSNPCRATCARRPAGTPDAAGRMPALPLL
jgi:hypothetical protein